MIGIILMSVFILSGVSFLLGMIHPVIVLWWFPSYSRTRGIVLSIYGRITVFSFILYTISDKSMSINSAEDILYPVIVISSICIFLGIIHPSIALWWRSPHKRTRGTVIFNFGALIIISVIGIGMSNGDIDFNKAKDGFMDKLAQVETDSKAKSKFKAEQLAINKEFEDDINAQITPDVSDLDSAKESQKIADAKQKQQAQTETNTSIIWSGCIDINKASFEELRGIIHIDEVRAQEIINIRPFNNVEDLTRVKGIAKVRMADILAQNIACAS